MKSSKQLSLDSKMNNIAKLRQQFVDEVKSVESSLKETIKNLKTKISEATKRIHQTNDKLKESNGLLCEQSEQIYINEQENRILKEQIQELYDYQKIICDNMDEISKTLFNHKELSNKLKKIYNSILSKQQGTIIFMKEKCSQIQPNKQLFIQLDELKLILSNKEIEKKNLEYEIKYTEQEFNKKRQNDELLNKTLSELQQKMSDLENFKIDKQQKSEEKKMKLTQEILNLENEKKQCNETISDLKQTIEQLKNSLEKSSNNKNNLENQLKSITKEIRDLENTEKELDISQSRGDEETSSVLNDLKAQLKKAKEELSTLKLKETQALGVFQNKINELNIKLQNSEDHQRQLVQFNNEMKKIQEEIHQITQQQEIKEKDINNKIRLAEEKFRKLKEEVGQEEFKNIEYESKIQKLHNEIKEFSDEYQSYLKISEKVMENAPKMEKSSIFNLPNPFDEDMETTVGLKSKRSLYTPLAEDDEFTKIDNVDFDEAYNRLTQNPISSPSLLPIEKSLTRNNSSNKTRKDSSRTLKRNKKH